MARLAVLVVSASSTSLLEFVSTIFLTSGLVVVAVGAMLFVTSTQGVGFGLVVARMLTKGGKLAFVNCLFGLLRVLCGIEAPFFAGLTFAETTLLADLVFTLAVTFEPLLSREATYWAELGLVGNNFVLFWDGLE